MIGLRSQFGTELVIVAVVAVVTAVVAAVAARRAAMAGRPWLGAAARVLAFGGVVAVIAATAMPRRFAIETDGDLVLRLGGGGLRDWRVLYLDPMSLASIELVANVLLYAAVAMSATLGWFRRRSLVLPLCLALSVAIESVQYLALGRVAALDDVLLNMAGAGLGYLVALAAVRWGPFRPGLV